MTDYKLYPNLPPSAPPENPQVAYHLSVIQAKSQGLMAKEQMFKKKYEKYTKILNQLRFQGWTGMYTLVVPSLSTTFIKNSHQNLPVWPIFGDKA